MVSFIKKYSIKIPYDLEPCMDFVSELIKSNNESDITDFTNVLSHFILMSKNAILSRNDFTLLFKQGTLEWINGESIQRYSVKTIFIDLGTMISENEQAIKRYIRNAWNRLNDLLCILNCSEAISMKNGETFLDSTEPETLNKIILSFSNLFKDTINDHFHNNKKYESRSVLSSIFQDILKNDIADQFMTIITYADLNFYHYKNVFKTVVSIFNNLKFLYIKHKSVTAVMDIIDEHKSYIAESLILPLSAYKDSNEQAKIIVCVKKIVELLPPEIIGENMRKYISEISLENLTQYFNNMHSMADSVLTDNPMSLQSAMQSTKTVTKTVTVRK